MTEPDLDSFVNITLDVRKVMNTDMAHSFLYFDFPAQGHRSIESIKNFKKDLGITMSKVSWVEFIDNKRIEVICRESIRAQVIKKLSTRIVHLSTMDVDSI